MITSGILIKANWLDEVSARVSSDAVASLLNYYADEMRVRAKCAEVGFEVLDELFAPQPRNPPEHSADVVRQALGVIRSAADVRSQGYM